MKSNAESTKDAKTDSEEDVRVTMILAMRRNTLAAKLMSIATLTIPEESLFVLGYNCSTCGSNADSSSKETLRDGGCDDQYEGP